MNVLQRSIWHTNTSKGGLTNQNELILLFLTKRDMRILLLFSIVALLTGACKKDTFDAEEQLKKDKEIIEKYLADNDLTAESTASGLYYIVNQQGSGSNPTSTSDVTVAYIGYYTNGSTFDQSSVSGVTFNLQNVIKGWTEGIPKFKQGGSGVLLIPSALGYGPNGNSTVPPNTVLIFDVEILEVLN